MSAYMKPFHQHIDGMPDLFHTYCDEHPDFGTCATEGRAHQDIAAHLHAEHEDGESDDTV